MDNINDEEQHKNKLENAFYAIYKAKRDFIKEVKNVPMNYSDFLFTQQIYDCMERLDSLRRTYLQRWLSEQASKKPKE